MEINECDTNTILLCEEYDNVVNVRIRSPPTYKMLYILRLSL